MCSCLCWMLIISFSLFMRSGAQTRRTRYAPVDGRLCNSGSEAPSRGVGPPGHLSCFIGFARRDLMEVYQRDRRGLSLEPCPSGLFHNAALMDLLEGEIIEFSEEV